MYMHIFVYIHTHVYACTHTQQGLTLLHERSIIGAAVGAAIIVLLYFVDFDFGNLIVNALLYLIGLLAFVLG